MSGLLGGATRYRANPGLLEQMMLDSAPAGSVGAPGGLLGSMPADAGPPLNPLQMGGMVPIPVVSDVAGVLGDLAMYQQHPETRTLGNYGLTALGALPFVPGMVHGVNANVFRGSKPGSIGEFWSRDFDTAKGFDKGAFAAKHAETSKALSFGENVKLEDAQDLIRVMREEGDDYAASQLEQVLKEDGEVPGSLFYMMMEQVGSASPEYYLRRAGVDAIDTGRDLRVLNPSILSDI